MRTSVRPLSLNGLLLAAAMWGWPCGAQAKSVSVHLNTTPAGDSLLLAQDAEVRGSGILRARLQLEYTARPLRLLTSDQRPEAVLERQLWSRLALSYAAQHRWLVSAELPLLLAQEGSQTINSDAALPNASSGVQLGDMRLGTRVRLFGAVAHGFQLALSADAWLPLGTEASYGSDGALRGRALLLAHNGDARLFWNLNAGFNLRPTERVASILPLRVGSGLAAAAGLGMRLDKDRKLRIGAEAYAEFVVADAKLLDPRSTWLQALATLGWRFTEPLEVSVSAGPGMGQGVGVADYRALVGLSWSPEQAPPAADRDGDGIPDRLDLCADLRGVPSGEPLMHGCPEVPRDFDGDAIPDNYDVCPRQPGKATALRTTHGCPEIPDRDRDGVADTEDACPDTPGTRNADGRKNGCPEEKQQPATPAAELVADQIVISERILFEVGTANLEPASLEVIDAVARVLLVHPELEEVEVQGHTDDTGSAEFNRRLSQERAERVRHGLLERGVGSGRLVAKGYGKERPLVTEASDAARARNRRVEFKVLRAAEDATRGVP